jgi:hypothetical protein
MHRKITSDVQRPVSEEESGRRRFLGESREDGKEEGLA